MYICAHADIYQEYICLHSRFRITKYRGLYFALKRNITQYGKCRGRRGKRVLYVGVSCIKMITRM